MEEVAGWSGDAGNLLTWGRGEGGRLGLGADTSSHDDPALVTALRDVEVAYAACGDGHAVVVTAERPRRTLAFGDGTSGQLGTGTSEWSSEPTAMALPPDHAEVIEVAVGNAHTLVLCEDGAVYACGSSQYGQLGLGDDKSQNLPQRIKSLDGKDVIHIACGSYHSFAVTANGALYAWGRSDHGQLGLNLKRGSCFLPRRVNDLPPIAACVGGRDHSVALSKAGQVFVCGANASGGGGGKKDADKDSAGNSAVFVLAPFAEAEEEAEAALAGKADGAIALQLGLRGDDEDADGDDSSRSRSGGPLAGLPKAARDAQRAAAADAAQRMVTISAGSHHAACCSASGALYTWGTGERGRLGHGNKREELVPRRVAALAGDIVLRVACGGSHTGALTDSGAVYMWGGGWTGQLGIGSRREVSKPTRVSAFEGTYVCFLALGGDVSCAVRSSLANTRTKLLRASGAARTAALRAARVFASLPANHESMLEVGAPAAILAALSRVAAEFSDGYSAQRSATVRGAAPGARDGLRALTSLGKNGAACVIAEDPHFAAALSFIGTAAETEAVRLIDACARDQQALELARSAGADRSLVARLGSAQARVQVLAVSTLSRFTATDEDRVRLADRCGMAPFFPLLRTAERRARLFAAEVLGACAISPTTGSTLRRDGLLGATVTCAGAAGDAVAVVGLALLECCVRDAPPRAVADAVDCGCVEACIAAMARSAFVPQALAVLRIVHAATDDAAKRLVAGGGLPRIESLLAIAAKAGGHDESLSDEDTAALAQVVSAVCAVDECRVGISGTSLASSLLVLAFRPRGAGGLAEDTRECSRAALFSLARDAATARLLIRAGLLQTAAEAIASHDPGDARCVAELALDASRATPALFALDAAEFGALRGRCDAAVDPLRRAASNGGPEAAKAVTDLAAALPQSDESGITTWTADETAAWAQGVEKAGGAATADAVRKCGVTGEMLARDPSAASRALRKAKVPSKAVKALLHAADARRVRLLGDGAATSAKDTREGSLSDAQADEVESVDSELVKALRVAENAVPALFWMFPASLDLKHGALQHVRSMRTAFAAHGQFVPSFLDVEPELSQACAAAVRVAECRLRLRELRERGDEYDQDTSDGNADAGAGGPGGTTGASRARSIPEAAELAHGWRLLLQRGGHEAPARVSGLATEPAIRAGREAAEALRGTVRGMDAMAVHRKLVEAMQRQQRMVRRAEELMGFDVPAGDEDAVARERTALGLRVDGETGRLAPQELRYALEVRTGKEPGDGTDCKVRARVVGVRRSFGDIAVSSTGAGDRCRVEFDALDLGTLLRVELHVSRASRADTRQPSGPAGEAVDSDDEEGDYSGAVDDDWRVLAVTLHDPEGGSTDFAAGCWVAHGEERALYPARAAAALQDAIRAARANAALAPFNKLPRGGRQKQDVEEDDMAPRRLVAAPPSERQAELLIHRAMQLPYIVAAAGEAAAAALKEKADTVAERCSTEAAQFAGALRSTQAEREAELSQLEKEGSEARLECAAGRCLADISSRRQAWTDRLSHETEIARRRLEAAGRARDDAANEIADLVNSTALVLAERVAEAESSVDAVAEDLAVRADKVLAKVDKIGALLEQTLFAAASQSPSDVTQPPPVAAHADGPHVAEAADAVVNESGSAEAPLDVRA